MFLAEIGTAGVISAYFFKHITSCYSLNVSDPIEGQPVQLSDYLCVFGCGLVFWLLVLLRANLHGSGDHQAHIRKVAKLAKLTTSITTINLCGYLLAPKLPFLVRFLVLFQVSSNLALLLIWTFLSLKECMIVPAAHTQQQQKSSPESANKLSPESASKLSSASKVSPESASKLSSASEVSPESASKLSPEIYKLPTKRIGCSLQASRFERVARNKAKLGAVHNVYGVGGKVDEAGGSGSGYGSGATGREENRGRNGGNDGWGGVGGGGDRWASGIGHGSVTSGSGENSGGYEGHGQDEGGTGRGGSEGGDGGRDGGGGDPEGGVRGAHTEQAFKSFKITEMSLMLTAQTTATLIGFHFITIPSSSSKALLVVALMDQLVAYLCGLTSILLSSNKPENSKAAKIFADIGFVCTALGFILMVAMFVPRYLVLIVVLLFGVVWFIFFRNGLKTRATEVWNYLKNSTKSLKNYIWMLFEGGS